MQLSSFTTDGGDRVRCIQNFKCLQNVIQIGCKLAACGAAARVCKRNERSLPAVCPCQGNDFSTCTLSIRKLTTRTIHWVGGSPAASFSRYCFGAKADNNWVTSGASLCVKLRKLTAAKSE